MGISAWAHWMPDSQAVQGTVVSSSSQGHLKGPARLVLGKKIPLNQATQEDLAALPGIGPSRAEAIVQWRNSRGSFLSLRGLLEVPGIGSKTFKGIQSYLSLNDSSL